MTKTVRGFTLWLAVGLFYNGADRLNGNFIFFDFKKFGESYFQFCQVSNLIFNFCDFVSDKILCAFTWNFAFLMEQHYFFYLAELETEGLGFEDKLQSFNSLISINPVAAFCPSCLWQNSNRLVIPDGSWI